MINIDIAWLLAILAAAVAVWIWREGWWATALVLISPLVLLLMDAFWDHMNSGEWTAFLVLFAIMFVISLFGGILGRWSVAVGVVMLVITLLLGSSLNISSPFTSAYERFKADIVSEVAQAKEVAALQKSVAALEKRVDANDALDQEQNKRIAALEGSDKAQQTAIDELNKKVTGVVATAPPIDLTKEEVADAVTKDFVDFYSDDPDAITVGTIDWDQNIRDVGARPFVDRTIDSLWKLHKQLNASTAQAKATLVHLFKAVPATERERLKSGRGFVPIQFNKKLCLEGNTYFLGGQAVRDGVNCHDPGDVIWVYVGSDKKVYWDASVRADCGNPGMTAPPRQTEEKPKKGKPGTPGTSGTPSTPGTPGTPGTPTTPSTSTSTPTPTKSTSTPSSTPTPTKSTSTPKPTPTPTKSTSTPKPTPTPSVTLSPKDPKDHPCGTAGNPACPTDPPVPAPAPTKPASSTPGDTPKPVYTTPAPPAASVPSSSDGNTATGTIGNG